MAISPNPPLYYSALIGWLRPIWSLYLCLSHCLLPDPWVGGLGLITWPYTSPCLSPGSGWVIDLWLTSDSASGNFASWPPWLACGPHLPLNLLVFSPGSSLDSACPLWFWFVLPYSNLDLLWTIRPGHPCPSIDTTELTCCPQPRRAVWGTWANYVVWILWLFAPKWANWFWHWKCLAYAEQSYSCQPSNYRVMIWYLGISLKSFCTR